MRVLQMPMLIILIYSSSCDTQKQNCVEWCWLTIKHWVSFLCCLTETSNISNCLLSASIRIWWLTSLRHISCVRTESVETRAHVLLMLLLQKLTSRLTKLQRIIKTCPRPSLGKPEQSSWTFRLHADDQEPTEVSFVCWRDCRYFKA